MTGGRRARSGRAPTTARLPTALALGAICVGCAVQIGPVAQGPAEARWEGLDAATLDGGCVHSVVPRETARLNHTIRLQDGSGAWNIVIASSYELLPGRREIPREAEVRDPHVTVNDGATSVGTVYGSIETTVAGDSIVHTLRGFKMGRDTVRVVAECRLGLLADP